MYLCMYMVMDMHLHMHMHAHIHMYMYRSTAQAVWFNLSSFAQTRSREDLG